MNTHDIELPPLPDWFAGYSSADKHVVQAFAYAAIEADRKRQGEVVVTKTPEGEIIAVTRQDDEGKILSVIAEADRKRGTAKQRYDEAMAGIDEPDPIERLRFFCSTAMSGQDWLDVEPLFDGLVADRQRRGEPVAWLYEDELPDNYPYDVMFAYSKVDGVRMFPVSAPQPAEPVKSYLTVKYDDKGDCLYVNCDSNEPTEAEEEAWNELEKRQ